MITRAEGFRLADHDAATPSVDKKTAQKRTRKAVAEIAELQARMMAADTWSMLAIFQGMDASGKDGTIDHVFSGVNPAGICVTSFKAPSTVERSHDFLWRIHQAVPPSGRIGVFNRSHYEDVLVPRIHPEQPHLQHIPHVLHPTPDHHGFWTHRLDDITRFERMLTRQGVLIAKFFMNISKGEQRERLLARLEEPDKNWKFQPTDLEERAHWDGYARVYEETIAATATEHAPWYIIPADHKWYARMVVAEIVAERLSGLDLKSRPPSEASAADLKAAEAALKAE
jgi:PPK2 family polyphosphate:nucleotide phosphotransferase